MDDKIEKVLIKAVKGPMIAVMKIINTDDSESEKIKAISLYCMFILKTINKTIIKENEK